MFKQFGFCPFVRYVAAASIWAGTAYGQAAPAEPTVTGTAAVSGNVAPANVEFDRGLAALNAGQYKDAVDLFNAAYLVDHNPAALMNLGIAFTNAGQLHSAVESLTRYTETANEYRDAETIAAVKAEIERIRSSNGVVVVHATPANAAIQLDGQMLSPVNGEVIVAPGQRHFVMWAEGFVTYDQVMAVAPGRFALDVTLTPVSAAPVALAVEDTNANKPDSDADSADEPEKSHGLNCVLNNVCFGPVLSLIGPPNLFGGGLHFRLGNYFGAGVDYQATPSISFDPVKVSSSLFSVNARVYPFANAFFLGGGFGYQSIRGALSNSDVTVAANASFPAAMASIGFMGKDGFVMGMDLGVMFPLGSSSVQITNMQVHRDFQGMSIPQSEIDDARGEVQSELKKVVDAMPVFFQLNLLRIGYLF
ncbi:MAG TPA: tetratricopeptide repeat protein [Polyangiales bacterium]|jgi:hypothetical protein|nr:tetratricopeptide repeat protein [Polyangiales bacterium]